MTFMPTCSISVPRISGSTHARTRSIGLCEATTCFTCRHIDIHTAPEYIRVWWSLPFDWPNLPNICAISRGSNMREKELSVSQNLLMFFFLLPW